MALVVIAGCGSSEGESAASEAVPWEVAERILAARQGEYTVRVTGVAPGGDEVVMRSETHRFDLDLPYKEIAIDTAGDPLTVVYTGDRSFMRSAQWEAACGTPWIETTAVEASQTPAERAADIEPVDALEAAVDEPRLIRTDDQGSTYEVTLPGTAALPPFPELPEVAAALAGDEQVATVTVPAGAGPLEIALGIDVAGARGRTERRARVQAHRGTVVGHRGRADRHDAPPRTSPTRPAPAPPSDPASGLINRPADDQATNDLRRPQSQGWRRDHTVTRAASLSR